MKVNNKSKAKENLVNNKDLYQLIQKKIPKDLEFKDYAELLNLFNEYVKELILETYEVRLPYLGVIRIKEFECSLKFNEFGNIINRKVDWKTTNALWKDDPSLKDKKVLIYYLNDHSMGKMYRIVWDKSNAQVRNKTVYNMNFSRVFKKQLFVKIKFENKEY